MSDDILDRLRDYDRHCSDADIDEAADEIARLRLTDEERAAVEAAAGDASQACCGEPPTKLTDAWRRRAATLRDLLERTK